MISVTKLASKSFSYVFYPNYKSFSKPVKFLFGVLDSNVWFIPFFFVFGSKWPKTKNQLSFSGKIQIFLQKIDSWLFFLWSLWPNNEKWNEPDMQLDCFLGTKDNAPSSTLSVWNQFTKVMFELFLSSWHFLSRYIFLLSKCLQYKFKTDLRRKITHFPLCLLLEFLFCYFGLHRCHEKKWTALWLQFEAKHSHGSYQSRTRLEKF